MAFAGNMGEEMGYITEVWFLGTDVAIKWDAVWKDSIVDRKRSH